MPVKDTAIGSEDKAYKSALTDVVIVNREVHISYKKSYGGMSPYIRGIMGGEEAKLLYTVCDNADGHDAPGTLRFQVPRADCPQCYERTQWELIPGSARFYVDTLSTAIELAGISFMNQLPVTVAWIKTVLPDATELDTLVAGMVRDCSQLKKGDELRPVFRQKPQANASDVIWVRKGTANLPNDYLQSKYYTV